MPSPDALLYGRHIEQRSRELDAMLAELGYDGLLIHSGRPQNRLFDDQPPPFRAHPPFVAWVPQPLAADSLLELRPGCKPRLWYCQPDDFWHLPPTVPPDWWSEALDIEIVNAPEDWHACFAGRRTLAAIGDGNALDNVLGGADLNPPELLWRLDQARTRKTAWERECIAQANRRAVAGHRAAAAAFDRAQSELGIHLAYLAAVGQDQDMLPYNSIVALNEHAAVLHYQYRDAGTPTERHSFLIDAGADCHGYAADITRTRSAFDSGDFRALIDAMDDLQQRLCAAARPGVSFVDLHRQAHLGVASILQDAGIVNMAAADQVETGVSASFLPHGLGHFLGVQVHDVAGQVDEGGQPLPPPDVWPMLRLTRVLVPGNVLTIEPGLYFIPSLLERLRASRYADRVDWSAVAALAPFGGIRIEDNILVSESDPVNFTRLAFLESS
ncbi:MAG: Xaa-Pro dipeptidase [Pseudomonadota bacterium]|nr:MAG: Xaa-Pro dipeptidase [Pseudomonadota bacterium]